MGSVGGVLIAWLLAGWGPLALATGLYVLQAIACARAGKPGLALTFFAYALANVGLIVTWIRSQ